MTVGQVRCGSRTSQVAPTAARVPVDPDERTLAELRHARTLYETFIAKADGDPRYEEAVRRSRDRIEDLDRTMMFVAAGIRERQAR